MGALKARLQELQDLLSEGLIDRVHYDQAVSEALAASWTPAGDGAGPSGPSVAKHSDETPARVGMYEILGVLGRGGMGVVYRARHRLEAERARQGGEVALKVLAPEVAGRPGFEARFLSEANLGIALEHPGIVRVLGAFQDGPTLAAVMELVDGEPLSSVLERTGPIPWARARSGIRQLLAAVGHAHDQGVVHRDLKPDNVMVRADGSWAVLDFGIARQEGADRLTVTGTALGTPDYMAPEQHEDAARADVRADVYGLGMTLYRVLAGRLPWGDRADLAEVVCRKKMRDFGPPTEHYGAIPGAVASAVMAALAVEPADRPRTVDELAVGLGLGGVGGGWTEEPPSGGRPPEVERAGGRRWAIAGLLGVLGVMGLAVVAGGVGLWWGAQQGGGFDFVDVGDGATDAAGEAGPTPTRGRAPELEGEPSGARSEPTPGRTVTPVVEPTASPRPQPTPAVRVEPTPESTSVRVPVEVILGNVAPFDEDSNTSPDHLLGSPLKVPVDSTLDAFALLARSGGPRVQMGLYRDSGGRPGSLFASSGIATLPAGGGVLELDVRDRRLPAGDYWLVAVFESTASVGYTMSSSEIVAYRTLGFGSALPGRFGEAKTYEGQEFNYWVVTTVP